MAPGSSSLLRARRRDATLKPNRVLDKSSSRGMIYENEELRLRTININAEVERSQSDIKKLRRENELLRREIWGLRDECDRLEELLKRKEEEDDVDEEEDAEEDEEDSSDDDDKEDGNEAKKRREKARGVLSSLGDTLSVVQEETEDAASREPTPQLNDNPERSCELYEGALPPILRVHCVHPFTAAATIDSTELPELTVGEVIEHCWKTVGTKLEGVRLLGDSLFLSLKDKSVLENLVAVGLCIRGVKVNLEDVSQGTLVLAMSGVPHSLEDQSLAKVLSQFGPIIGFIERRFYRNVDTGERLARIRLMSSLPKRIYVEGHEIAMRSLPHDELAKLAMLPSRIVRSTLQVSVNQNKPEKSEANTSGLTSPPITSSAPPFRRSSTPFVFPTPTSPQSSQSKEGEGGSSPSGLRRGGDSETSGSTRRSRQRVRRGHSPSSSSEQESPNKPPRRKMSTRRREQLQDDGLILLDRERSNSLSSRCSGDRRKLSFTGRESGKLPWFGCWGNGCI